MNELTNEDGIVCASIGIVPEDSEAWAIFVSWKRGVDGLPDGQAALSRHGGMEARKVGAFYPKHIERFFHAQFRRSLQSVD